MITYDRSRTESGRVERCWSWFRYLTKRLYPDQSIRVDSGGLVSCREIFKPSHPFIETAPMHCAQIASGSHNIWTKAQAEAGFKSRFLHDDQLDRLYDGSELVERQRAIADAENAAWQATALRTLDL